MIVQTKNYTVLALSDFLKVNGEIVMKSKSKIFDVKFDDRMMLMVENPNPKSVVLSQIPINMLTQDTDDYVQQNIQKIVQSESLPLIPDPSPVLSSKSNKSVLKESALKMFDKLTKYEQPKDSIQDMLLNLNPH